VCVGGGSRTAPPPKLGPSMQCPQVNAQGGVDPERAPQSTQYSRAAQISSRYRLNESGRKGQGASFLRRNFNSHEKNLWHEG